MTDLRDASLAIVTACVQAVGVVWLIAAGYFAARRPGPWTARLRLFLVTFLPEPWLVLFGPLAYAALVAVPDRVWADVVWRSRWLEIAGVALAVAGTALMIWARWTLGAMWAGRPLLQESHELCTTGPYAYVRHPIYTGTLVIAAGAALAYGMGMFLGVVAALGVFVWWRVRREDAMMGRTFGVAAARYRAAVPALLPRAFR